MAALLLGAWQCPAQQSLPVPPPPSAEGSSKPAASKDKGLTVPMLDEPPTLTIPLPKKNKEPEFPAKDKGKGKEPATGTSVEKSPLPELRPVGPTTAPANANASSTSELGQFVIHGADLESRTFINKLCEETAEQMARLLHDTERYEIPIVISVKTPPNVSLNGPAVGTDIAQLAFGGFRLQITIQVRPDFNVADFRDELVRMLIAERILRGHKELTTTRTRILPDWLLTGVKEAMRYRNRSRPSAVFAAVFRTGKIYGIEEILETTPGSLDALSRAIYETSCCALVLTLLDQPDGNLRMAKFLNALATETKSDREMLNRWFPGLNASKTSLNKWWSIQMANLATPTVFETLGPSETAKELDQALQLHFETTPDDAPVAHVASADEESLKADAEKESKKRGFFGRLFSSDKTEKPADAEPAKEELKAGNKAKPAPLFTKTEKPKEESQKKEVPAPKDQPVTDGTPAPEKSGFRMRNLFGFGSGSPVVSTVADDKPKAEPKKEDKPKAEPKKEDKPKAEPKKDDKPKAEPKKEDKPKADADTDSTDGDKKKRRGFFGRMLRGKEEAKPDDKAQDSDKKDDKPKAKKPNADNKPSAAIFNESLMLRMVADITVPSLSIVFQSADLLQADQPRNVAFLGFGKKKEKTDDADEEAPKKEDDKKDETKKKKAKEEPKPEPKKEEKPPAKKERLISVSVPLSDYARIQKRSDAKKIFNATATTLSALATRAHPLFRPLIREYVDLALELANHKAKDVDARLKELKARRDQILVQAKAVRDYLDWFEASESNEYSGLFDDYLRLPKTIDQEIPRRADPISKILDEAEQANR